MHFIKYFTTVSQNGTPIAIFQISNCMYCLFLAKGGVNVSLCTASHYTPVRYTVQSTSVLPIAHTSEAVSTLPFPLHNDTATPLKIIFVRTMLWLFTWGQFVCAHIQKDYS